MTRAVLSSRADNPGGNTKRTPYDDPAKDDMFPSAIVDVEVVPVVMEIMDEGVHGVSGGGDMGVIGVFGHTLGELGVVVEAEEGYPMCPLCCCCCVSSLRQVGEPLTSCLNADPNLNRGDPGVKGVTGDTTGGSTEGSW